MVNQYPLIINKNILYNTNNIECIHLSTYINNKNQMQLKWEFKFKSKTQSVTQIIDDQTKIDTVKNYIDNNGICTLVQVLSIFGQYAYLDQFIPNIDMFLSLDASTYSVSTPPLSDIIIDGYQISGDAIEYIKFIFTQEKYLRAIIKTNKKTYSCNFDIPSDVNITDDFIEMLLDNYARSSGAFDVKHEINNLLTTT